MEKGLLDCVEWEFFETLKMPCFDKWLILRGQKVGFFWKIWGFFRKKALTPPKPEVEYVVKYAIGNEVFYGVSIEKKQIVVIKGLHIDAV